MIKVAVIDNGIIENEIPGIVVDKKVTFAVEKKSLESKFWYDYHGTICADIIYNICTEVLFYDVKVTDGGEPFSVNTLINALKWCEKEEIKIINLSLGVLYTYDVEKLKTIIKRLVQKNFFLVASAHVGGMISYPAEIEGVFSASCNENGKYAVSIPNCKIAKKKKVNVNSHNSFAAPVITGYIVLYLKKNIYATRKEVEQYLLTECKIIRNERKKHNLDVPVIMLKLSEEERIKIISSFQNRKYLVETSDSVAEINAKANHEKCNIVFAYGKKEQEELSDMIIRKTKNKYEIIGDEGICNFNDMNYLIEYIENKFGVEDL